MNKDIKYFGIDISHLVFDVTDSDGNYYQFKNSVSGFKKFLKLLDFNSHCVMEATGYYHYQLAYYLQEEGIKVSVENPLSVKRFIQMKLSKIKTDKSDSKLICEYAKDVKLKLWKGNSEHQLECLQMTRLLGVYTIGPKTSLMLVVLTDGFDRFTSGSELCSYAGLTPVIRQSGSSVKGLKQAFAIAKSGLTYDNNYRSVLLKN